MAAIAVILPAAFSFRQGTSSPAPFSEAERNGAWNFSFRADWDRSGALLDLRYLNEKQAGESGFVRRSPDGTGFVLGNGRPVRFWAVNTTMYRKPMQEVEQHARFLARIGVNMVRMHGSISPKKPGSTLEDVDEQEIENAHKLVAAMKKQGIYCTISPWWANGGHAGSRAGWGLEEIGDGQDIWGLLFFEDRLKAAYKGWVRRLYTRKNPYTGLSLAQDPAVAVIQIQNEDSLFFWTLQGLKPYWMRRLGAQFGSWCTRRYGSLEKTLAAWQGMRWNGDDLPNGVLGLMNIYQMTLPQQGGAALRIRDEVQFLAEKQFAFYAEMAKFYREELGCRQLINACNWKTGSPERLEDIERYTYTATDVSAVNRYYNGGPHTGPNSGWRIEPGHTFLSESAVRHPDALPLNLKLTAGTPMLISESAWVHPLLYQSEGPFLVAAYCSLVGAGPYYWFAAGEVTHDQQPYFPWQKVADQQPLMKFGLSPVTLTSFPAAALMYRTQAVRPGPVVAHEERPLADLWDRKVPLAVEGSSYDPNRDRAGGGEGRKGGTVHPLAGLVGRVEAVYGGDPAKTRITDTSKYILPDQRRVVSATGEISLDWGEGICTVNTPTAQGVTGELAGTTALRDVEIDGKGYHTALAVSVDGAPLASASKVLLQVTTVSRPTDWKVEVARVKDPDTRQEREGLRVVQTGRMPWRMGNARIGLSLRNPSLRTAVVLDTAGFPVREIPLQRQDGKVSLRFPPDAVWVILQQHPPQ
jgi:hypothetical protein